jgi:mannose-6-phosphate isomerase-like protein (cupin superfamily)
MNQENHNLNIVTKPWGYEYLAYENDEVALWALFIFSNQSTSVHCHAKKTTGLIVLDGQCEVSFISNSRILNPLDKVMIRKGLFHSTKSISPIKSVVFEIETPKDKLDLVRFRDNYGREGKPYEDHTFQKPKQKECLWIEDQDNDYEFENCLLKLRNITDINFFKTLDENEKIIFLKGGILSEDNQYVVTPGDIITNKSILELTTVFKKIDPNTKILLIEK